MNKKIRIFIIIYQLVDQSESGSDYDKLSYASYNKSAYFCYYSKSYLILSYSVI